MSGRVIEVGSDGKHLSVYRGFLKVSEKGNETARVALGDICSIIVSGHGITYSNDLITRLAERNIWLVACGNNYQPAAWLWPAGSHSVEAQRLDLQINLTKPKKKQVWADLVRGKISGQIEVLYALGKGHAQLDQIRSKVRSGDENNCEAFAAAIYWKSLFGSKFRRDRRSAGANAALNYGYTVLRSCVSRAITGAGLHPNVPLHHRNKYSGFRFTDDLMEVFRPVVDITVHQLAQQYDLNELDAEVKARLASVLEHVVVVEREHQKLSDAAVTMTHSFLALCAGSVKKISLPSSLAVDVVVN